MTTALNQLARMSAQSMLNGVIEGFAIGLFAWLLLRVVGRRNSSTRFAVWFSALLAIAALPLLSAAPSKASPASITVSSAWALDIFLLWAALAAVALVRVAVGLLQLRKLRASCTPIDVDVLDPALRKTLQEFQTVRSVALCQSDRLQVPTAIGFVKPAVVIPSWAMQELSTPELNAILLHELAHLRRRDDWTNLAQKILKALLFFHPAVWWIENQLTLEREMACDDAVLAETANPRDYAQCLIAMAEKSFMRRSVALAQAAVNRMRHMSQRVSQILDANRPGATRVWKPAVYSLAAFFVACLASLPHAPELIAFEDRVPEVAVASAMPASSALATPTHSDALAPQPVAIDASFHPAEGRTPQITTSANRQNSGYEIQPRSISPKPQPAEYEMRNGASSPVPKHVALLMSQYPDHLTPEGTSSLVPQETEIKTGLQPRVQVTLAQLTIADEAAPQAIFVVMQTTPHQQAGPTLWTLCVWRVTVVDLSRVPAEIRIPTKKI
jgi:beta-lactamase regulating signal transducer with metallopeptidase domain